MKIYTKVIFIFLIAIIAVGFFPIASKSAPKLLKAPNSSTVFYLDQNDSLHVFPSADVYRSWYGDDFSQVVTMPLEEIAKYPLGKNIVVRSGTKLIKVRSRSNVYAVEPGGLIRHIENEELAINLYGANWAKKVIDIPEVFWFNYTQGEPIKYVWQIPEGVVYQIQDKDTYYWKEDSYIRPFENLQAVIANKYSIDNVIVATNTYYSMSKPISGLDSLVFDPAEEPYVDSRDCENKDIKVAFLFINKGQFINSQIEKIVTIKKNLPTSFSTATKGLSEVDTDFPTHAFTDDGYLIRKEEGVDQLVKDEIAHAFYKNNKDIFDFLVIFTSFDVFKDDITADFMPISNRVSGLGKPLVNNSKLFGSDGKLKGIINMGNIDKYDIATTSDLNEVEYYVMHEILHNWSGATRFMDESGVRSELLLRKPDKVHWSYYDGFISPLGGSGWQDNGDGTFTNILAILSDPYVRPFADIDLYLMGLIPAQTVDPIFYLEPTIKDALGNVLQATAHSVTIDQIIAAEGEWRCVE
ncbi:hypothetical protein KKA15_00160 [Patescibacteria group bacterium]|nr:hypothetical protein [Patescibacteria group bacterium]